MRIIVDGKPYPFSDGDTLLIAMLRHGLHPTGGGTLCNAGDSPHGLATVDGVAYVHTSQVKAKPGMVVVRENMFMAYPALPKNHSPHAEHTDMRHKFCDVLIIGLGDSGQAALAEAQAAGRDVVAVDAMNGEEAVAIYAGPRVVVRTDACMYTYHPREEIIVATGAAEIPTIAPGADRLSGLVTSRLAAEMVAAGIDLGKVISVGFQPEGVETEHLDGDVVRLLGEDDKLNAVVMADEAGNETTHACDTLIANMGIQPRSALFLMGQDVGKLRIIGRAALDSTIPKMPKEGIVDSSIGASVADLEFTWESGFREMELIKRSTLSGTGWSQGNGSLPYMQSFILEKGKELQPRFTARPMTRQPTLGEIAAGGHYHPTARTALDGVHRHLGAQMERSGGWWRPWTYGDLEKEYWAVREAVSIMDVSTLGKMTVTGPDALELLERLYPTHVRTIREGRTRYVLLLNERGYVMDDGLIGKVSDTEYTLTLTSGGISNGEMWMRDWADGWEMDVHLINQTYSMGAINVTGPLASKLLEKAGMSDPMKFMRFADLEMAGVPCRVYRLSFTGEASYELHHPADRSVELWEALMSLGAEFGIHPHGLEALVALRLEKGHVIVGQDTDYDSTPRRLHHEWMCRLDKEYFIGKASVERTNRVELDKMLVGFEIPEGAPAKGPL
ncbi:MAG: 2Fe-2S iron-sulfur cluster-binding protein, partial [Chloroflexota bacterium]